MGGHMSNIPAVQEAPHGVHYACIQPANSDELRFFWLSPQLRPHILPLISQAWPVQKSRELGAVTQVKLAGSPWWTHSKQKRTMATALFTHVHCFLANNGWLVETSVDMTRFGGDCQTWFIRFDPASLRGRQTVCCISMHAHDRIRMIGMPPALHGLIDKHVQENWALGLQNRKILENVGAPAESPVCELKLRGTPWFADGEETVAAVRLVGGIVAEMRHAGWVLDSQADISRNEADASSLHFRYAPEAIGVDEPLGFLCVSLHRHDRIRISVSGAEIPPQSVIDAVTAGLAAVVGAAGIQRQAKYAWSWEWKLAGSPWFAHGNEAFTARRLICHVFHALRSLGYVVTGTADISQKSSDKSCTFFRFDQPPTDAAQGTVFAVSLNSSDKLRVINGAPTVVEGVRNAVANNWVIQRETAVSAQNAHEFKLAGSPWQGYSSKQVAVTRLLMCCLLHEMRIRGFECRASIDMSAKTDDDGNSIDLHTLFFFAIPRSVHTVASVEAPPPYFLPPTAPTLDDFFSTPMVNASAPLPAMVAGSGRDAPPPSYTEVVGGGAGVGESEKDASADEKCA